MEGVIENHVIHAETRILAAECGRRGSVGDFSSRVGRCFWTGEGYSTAEQGISGNIAAFDGTGAVSGARHRSSRKRQAGVATL